MPHPKTLAGIIVIILAVATFAYSFIGVHAADAQSSDHMTSDQSHIPTASIGDRQLALDFSTTPVAPLPAEPVSLNLSLMDKNTGKDVLHASYTVIITREDGKQVFTLVVHGHDGKVSIRFINDPSADPYTVSANYDNLSASYVSDFGSPIKVQGQVFSTPGNYKVAIEVTGIDHDNTFLQQPLKYNFVLPVAPKQTLAASYQNTTFNIGAYSSMTFSKAELKTESRQLVLSTSSSLSVNATTHSGDLTVKLEIPKQMMSGPFSASLGSGAVLDVKEDSTASASDQITTLILTGKHDDIVQADAPTGSNQPIVVTAASVVPEFPAGLAGSVAAVGLAAIILYVRTRKAGKMEH